VSRVGGNDSHVKENDEHALDLCHFLVSVRFGHVIQTAMYVSCFLLLSYFF
jgi:hypothetical protein